MIQILVMIQIVNFKVMVVGLQIIEFWGHMYIKILNKKNIKEKSMWASLLQKKAKSESFAIDDFNFEDEVPLEDFDGDSPDLKVLPLRAMKPNTKIEIKPLKLKEDDRVKGK